MPEKLEFEISASDKSGQAADSAVKNAHKIRNAYADIFKADSANKGIQKLTSNFKKLFQNLKQSQRDNASAARQFGKAGEEGVGVAGITAATGQEDVAAAQKTEQIGKRLQERRSGENRKVVKTAKETSEHLQKGGKQFREDMKKSRLEIERMGVGLSRLAKRRMGGVIPGGGFGGFPGGARGGGGTAMAGVEAQQVGALQRVGATLPYAGAALAGAAGLYQIASARVGAFRRTAGPQLQYLQQLGRVSNQTGYGFFTGMQGLDVTGTQRAAIMATYARQSNRSGAVSNVAQAAQAFGMDYQQTATYAGTFDRFQRNRRGAGNDLMAAIGAATKSGMGGARLPEFLDSFKGILTESVAAGSKLSNAEILSGLTTLMTGSDERLKSIIPQTIKGSLSAFRGAAGLQGTGPQSMMLQSVWQQMERERGGRVGLQEVREKLYSGSPTSNMRAVAQSLKGLGIADSQAAMIMGNMGILTKAPKAQLSMYQKLLNGQDVEKSASGSIADLTKKGQAIVEGRRDVTERARRVIVGREIADSNMAVRDMNEKLIKHVDFLRNTIQKLITKVESGAFEKGQEAISATREAGSAISNLYNNIMQGRGVSLLSPEQMGETSEQVTARNLKLRSSRTKKVSN
jgi:hypothetical protein